MVLLQPLPPPLLNPASSSTLSPLVPASPSFCPQSAPGRALWSSASGILVSSSAQACGSPVSTSNLRALDYISVLRPIGSALAPSSLVSTVARHPTSSIGLPRPSGSGLVSRRPSAASSLHSSGSVRLLLPSGTTFILSGSGSAVVFQIPASISVAWAFSSA